MTAPAEDWLAPIRARANAATPGPWTVERGSSAYQDVEVRAPGNAFVALTGDPTFQGTVADAAFIAGTREDVPRLLDEVDRLRATLERVRSLLGEDYQRSGREVSCGGYLVTDDGCFAGSLARRITAALDGQVAP